MILLIVGVLLILTGLFAGTVLVAVPLGLLQLATGPALWVLFPVCCVAGYVLFAIGGRMGEIRGLSLAISGLLLMLAVASAIGLVLGAAGMLHADGSTLSLWYVMIIAGMAGFLGSASFGRAAPQS
ncbi:MAG: hypothetical protein V4582_02675 [Pseudomonadota bacterium]